MELPDSSEDGGLHMCDPTVTSVSACKKDKLCLVCGDKALGYNFNAVSCESCKAFFRRNAHKTIRGRCEGRCDVNVESRSFCKRCRLAKCFTVGMRKDMILNDEQKKVRKQKIMFNKLRRQGHLPAEDKFSVSPHDLDSSAATFTPATFTSTAFSLGDVKVKQESSSLPQTSLPPSSRSPKENSPLSYPPWAESQELVAQVIEQLPEDQQKLVAELRFAMQESAFLTMTSTSVRSLPTSPTEFVNMAEGFVRKVIKVAKNITAFKTLEKDDQISLLKGSVVDIMMLRSAVNYDPHTETWSLSTKDCLSRHTAASEGAAASAATTAAAAAAIASSCCSSSSSCTLSPCSTTSSSLSAASTTSPRFFAGSPPGGFGAGSPPGFGSGNGSGSGSVSIHGQPLGRNLQVDRISAEVLKSGNPETLQLFMNYSKFIKSLMTSIHGDLLVLKILIMMSLFSADRSAHVDRAKVQAVQENYATVLQQYTGLRFPEDRTLFARLVMKLTDLRNINEVHSKMLLKMKVDDIEPLLLEIFDL